MTLLTIILSFSILGLLCLIIEQNQTIKSLRKELHEQHKIIAKKTLESQNK